MRKTVVAVVLAAASVLSLAGCSGGHTAAPGCAAAYHQEKNVSDELRQIVVGENKALSLYTEGTFNANELAAVLGALDSKLNKLNDTEAAIDASACSTTGP